MLNAIMARWVCCLIGPVEWTHKRNLNKHLSGGQGVCVCVPPTPSHFNTLWRTLHTPQAKTQILKPHPQQSLLTPFISNHTLTSVSPLYTIGWIGRSPWGYHEVRMRMVLCSEWCWRGNGSSSIGGGEVGTSSLSSGWGISGVGGQGSSGTLEQNYSPDNNKSMSLLTNPTLVNINIQSNLP